MAMQILKLAPNNSNSILYDPTFCRYLETYLPYLKAHSETKFIPVIPHDLYKYEGDFYGLLSANNVSRDYHWIVMRANDVASPAVIPLGLGGLVIPSFNVIDQICQIYRTKEKTVAP